MAKSKSAKKKVIASAEAITFHAQEVASIEAASPKLRARPIFGKERKRKELERTVIATHWVTVFDNGAVEFERMVTNSTVDVLKGPPHHYFKPRLDARAEVTFICEILDKDERVVDLYKQPNLEQYAPTRWRVGLEGVAPGGGTNRFFNRNTFHMRPEDLTRAPFEANLTIRGGFVRGLLSADSELMDRYPNGDGTFKSAAPTKKSKGKKSGVNPGLIDRRRMPK